MKCRKITGLAAALVLVSSLNARADFFVEFDGPAPSPPFQFNNQFLWDQPEPGLATMRTNQGGGDVQQETNLYPDTNPAAAEVWDPSIAGTYEVTCMVVSHTAGLGAGALDMFYAAEDWSWTITWTEFFVSLDIQFEQIEVPSTQEDYVFEMDTTDDFHCYEVQWDPNVPSATLFVDGENTGITLGDDLLANSRGRTELVLGDAYGGTLGGEIIFDSYGFSAGVGVDPEVCDDGEDNDGDGDIDCDDANCLGEAVCPEICDDGQDNDGDGNIDCADHADCDGNPACPAEVDCEDGQDNDFDDSVDCGDADCDGQPGCPRDAPYGFEVDFDGMPAPPFVFNNQFSWDDPEVGLASMRTNGAGGSADSQQETNLKDNSIPITWDPSVPGSYEVCALVVGHTAGIGAGTLDFMSTDPNFAWTLTWTESFVGFDNQWVQWLDNGNLDYTFDMDTTDDFHCYRVDWNPDVPSATLFVDDENTGITLSAELCCSRGRTDLVLGDAYGGSTGGEIVFDHYSFTPGLTGPTAEVCADGADNDEDGATDCDDTDCEGHVACLPEGVCDDGQDDDQDGDTDCADSDCAEVAACAPEGTGDGDCSDGQDNDRDGDIDCADADCAGAAACEGSPASPSFRVDFTGKPSLPFVFNNDFLWDVPEPGLGTMSTNQEEQPNQQELGLNASGVPVTWDPSVAGSYEVSCMVVNHTAGLGAGALDMFYADKDYSWTITWTEFFVSLDIQFEQIEVPATAQEYSFEMDTTDNFHCYRVDWDPEAPSATLFVDGEDTGITLGPDLLANSRGRTELVLGDAYGGTLGGEIVFDDYTFTPKAPDEVCDDGEDNDGDGDADCADADCEGNAACVEVCNDGQDNDGDGDADCADADCEGDAACPTGVGPFIRGDCDGNGTVGGSPTEAIVLLNFAFRGGAAPGCLAACDAEANGSIGITDALRILRHSFLGIGEPDAPFPDCVTSDLPTDEALGCEVLLPCP